MAEDLGEGVVTVTLDESDATTAARRLGAELTRILDRASRAAGIRVARNLTNAIARLNPLVIDVDADTAAAQAAINSLSGGTVTVDVDADITAAQAAINSLTGGTVTVDVDVDRGSLSRASSAISGLGKALGGLGALSATAGRLTATGIAAASAAQSIAGLTAALAPAIGIIAAGPAVILGFQAALGGLKLALSGVSDAFKAGLTGTTDQFNKALENLSPRAKAAAVEVRLLKPAFEELRNTVQDSFFARIEGEITATAKALSGPLKGGLSTIGAAWGQAARNVLQYVRSTDGVNNVSTILGATTKTLTGLSAVTDDVAAGFLQVGASVAKAFGTKASNTITDLGNKVSAFLIKIADNGQAVQWVSDAIVVFRQLGSIAANVGGVISNVFKAAEGVGGGVLNNLKQLTQAMQDFTGSAQGQEAIGNIFATVSTIAAQLAPIIGAVVSALGQVAPALQPLFTTIGPAITSVIQALTPAIAELLPGVLAVVNGIVGALNGITGSGALTAISTAFSTILTSLAPLLPLIGDLVGAFVTALAPALTQLALAAQPVIEALVTSLTPQIPKLAEAFGSLALALVPLVTMFNEDFANAVAVILPAMVQALIFLTEALAGILTAFNDADTALTAFGANVARVVATIILKAVAEFTHLPQTIAIALAGLATAVQNRFNEAKAAAIRVVSSLLTTVSSFFASLPGRVASAIAPVVQAVTGAFVRARDGAVAAVSRLVSSVISFIASIPGKAAAALSGLGGVLVSAGASLISGLISGITSKFDDVRGVLGDLTSKLTSWKGPPRKDASLLTPAGKSIIQGLINGFDARFDDVKASLGKLTTAIRDAFRGRNTKIDDVLITQLQRNEKTLLALAKRREGIAEQIKKANEFALQTAQSALQGGALQGLNLDDGVKGVTFGIRQATAQINKFNAMVASLAKKGLRKDLLSQIIGLGPEQGAALASTLNAASGAELKSLNEAQKNLAASAKTFGNTAADALFDAGAAAGRGLLSGLKAQQKAIGDLMVRIARQMASSIRSALGIHSPSRVFKAIGANTMRGLEGGVSSRMAQVRRTAVNAAAQLADPFGGVSPSLGSFGPVRGRQIGAQGFGGAASAAVTNNRTVAPVFNINNVDSKSTADRVLARLVAATATGL